MEKELWKDIPNYEGLYQVSNLGNIKSLPKYSYRECGKVHCFYKEKILVKSINIHGYIWIALYKNRHRKIYKLHQLVAMAFLNHKPDGTQKIVVDHINDIKSDNRLQNIQLITQRENAFKTQGKGSSKHKGVSLCKRTNKFVSQIRINGKQTFLGRFNNEEEAHQSYQNKLKTL